MFGFKAQLRVVVVCLVVIFQMPGFAQAASLSVSKNAFQPSESIQVSFDKLPRNSNDWIGIFDQGAENRDYIDFIYTGGAANGTISFESLRPGLYEARVFYRNSYKPRATVKFKVTK